METIKTCFFAILKTRVDVQWRHEWVRSLDVVLVLEAMAAALDQKSDVILCASQVLHAVKAWIDPEMPRLARTHQDILADVLGDPFTSPDTTVMYALLELLRARRFPMSQEEKSLSEHLLVQARDLLRLACPDEMNQQASVNLKTALEMLDVILQHFWESDVNVSHRPKTVPWHMLLAFQRQAKTQAAQRAEDNNMDRDERNWRQTVQLLVTETALALSHAKFDPPTAAWSRLGRTMNEFKNQ